MQIARILCLPPGGRGTVKTVEGARATSVYRLFYPYRITVYKPPSQPQGWLGGDVIHHPLNLVGSPNIAVNEVTYDV
jgi:hypothetical protein